MEIEGYGLHVFRIPCQAADMVNVVLVDLVDGHVEADIAGGSIPDILQNGIVSIATDGVVPLPVTVQAQEDQVSFRQIDGEGTVGDHVDDQEAHFFGFDHQIPECLFAIPPKEGLAAAEEQDSNT